MTKQELMLPDEAKSQQNIIAELCIDFLSMEPSTYEVTCEDTAKQALSYSLQACKLKCRIEDTRKEIVRPHIDFQKAIMQFSKDFSEKLDSIEACLHVKIAEWMKTKKDDPFNFIDEIVVEDGKITCKTNWDFELQDERLVPPEYLTVDVAAIEKAIKNGVRNIPGTRIFSYESTQMRVKN